MSQADAVLATVLAALPPDQRGALAPNADAALISCASVLDPAWLQEQIRLRGQRWRTEDRRVLATLWWYSASVWIPGPTLASLVLADAPLSPSPTNVAMHWLPDSRIAGATSSAVLAGSPLSSAGAALRESLGEYIAAVARAGSMRERPLWAIAADSIAGRLLWIERATGRRASMIADELAAAIGTSLPRFRYLDIAGRTGAPTRVVRRGSCCLLYAAPGQDKCSDCPGRRRGRSAELPVQRFEAR